MSDTITFVDDDVTIVDSAGNGNDGTLDPFSGGALSGAPGSVAGNAAITIDHDTGVVGRVPVSNTGWMAGSFWIVGFITATSSFTNVTLVEHQDGAACLIFTYGGTFLQLVRYWGDDESTDDDIVSVAFTADNEQRLAGVKYDADADEYQFYFDGAPLGSPIAGSGHASSTRLPTSADIGEGLAAKTLTYDEIGWGAGAPSDADFAALFAARDDFDAWTAAALAMGDGAEALYHLDELGDGSAPDAVVTNVDPSSGSIAGGNTVTITGTGFTDASDVVFDGLSAESFTVDDDTQITAVVPAHVAGIGTVVVTT